MLDNFDVYKASQRFIEIRTNAGKTQEQLAEELGVNSQTIKNYEKAGSPNAQSTSSNSRVNAIAGMKIETLYKMAKLFNVSADYLLGLTNDPFPAPRAVDALGLSSNTIQRIIDFRPDPNDPFKFWIPADTLNILDWLLSSSRHLFPLIFIFDKLRDDAKEMYAAKKAFDNNSTAALRDAFIEAGDQSELTEYRATKEFSKLMEEYINDYCLHLVDPSEGEWRLSDDGND